MARARISGTVKIVEKDRGWKELKARLQRRLNGLSISAGVQGNEAAATYENGATVGEVASYAEFGTETQPPRPFLQTAAEQHNLWRQDIVSLSRRAIDEDPVQLARTLSLKVRADIQEKIDSSIPPPNAPSTAAAKDTTTTLIDSGTLRESVTVKVSRGKQTVNLFGE